MNNAFSEYDQVILVHGRRSGKSTELARWAVEQAMKPGARVAVFDDSGRVRWLIEEIMHNDGLFTAGFVQHHSRHSDQYKFDGRTVLMVYQGRVSADYLRGQQWTATGVDGHPFGNTYELYMTVVLNTRLDRAKFVWVADSVTNLTGDALVSTQERKRNGDPVYVSIEM